MAESRLLVPPQDKVLWPTLGWQTLDWMHEHLVHGPGDIKGVPLSRIPIHDELQAFILRCYEVFPKNHRRAGRRRFKRCAISRRKGFAKTAMGAFIAIAEMDPTAPVRALTDGDNAPVFRRRGDRVTNWEWDPGPGDAKDWVPVGVAVSDPYIPIVATTEEQSTDLGFGVIREILLNCELGNSYVVTEERVVHRDAPGKLQALAGAPNARDGALTSFEWFDETHGFLSDRLRGAHATMLRNVPKRIEADAWTLETSTMYGPGEESIAEATHAYALAVLEGQIEDADLLFDHLESTLDHDESLRKMPLKRVREAIEEASGDALDFADVDAILGQLHDPRTDESDFRRFWLNQRVRSSKRWINPDAVKTLGTTRDLEPGETIVLAFDGSESRDSTALVAATVEQEPHIVVVGHWARPPRDLSWRVSRGDVEKTLRWAIDRFTVLELAPDPWGWWKEIEEWEAEWGVGSDDPPGLVTRYPTKTTTRFGPACDAMGQALKDATVSFRRILGDAREDERVTQDRELVRHFGNCVPVVRSGYTVVTKEDKDSPNKIDLAVGAITAHDRARWHHANPRYGEFMWAYA